MQNLILSPIDPDYLIESIADRIAEKLSLNLPSPDKPDKPMRMKPAAEYLGISKQTLYQYVMDGKIRPRKAGKFSLFYRADLDAFIRGDKPETNDASQFIKTKKPQK